MARVKKQKTLPPTTSPPLIGEDEVQQESQLRLIQSNLTQYLHWALIAVHRLENPDCDEVVVRVNLKRRGTITEFVKAGEVQDRSLRIGLGDAATLRALCDTYIEVQQLRTSPELAQVRGDKARALFLELTGFPLSDNRGN